MRSARRWIGSATAGCVLVASSGLALAGTAPKTVRGITARAPAADFVLTAHTGDRVRLSDFRGKLVLLYFGYSHCPGICPTTLAEISQALKQLGPARGARVQVAMVSVDPERDSPERLAAYLAHFDRLFVGLTGTPEEISEAAARYGIYYRKGEGPAPSEYVIDHTSMTIVIDPAGEVRVLFPFGTRGKEMAGDLAQLLSAEPAADGPRIAIQDARARPVPKVVESSEIYMVITNAGSKPDKLVGARSPACGMVELYSAHKTPQGAMAMRPVESGFIEVAAKNRVTLEAGGLHLMCMHRKVDFKAGTRFPVTLKFTHAGEKMVQVAVRE